MKMTNETYDKLNKLHRGVLMLAEIIGVITVIAAALTEQGIVIPSIVSTVIAVLNAVIGRLLTISSENYWKERNDD